MTVKRTLLALGVSSALVYVIFKKVKEKLEYKAFINRPDNYDFFTDIL